MRTKFPGLLTVILFLYCMTGSPTSALAQTMATPLDTVPMDSIGRVDSIDAADLVDVTVPAVDGKISWGEVGRTVADAMTLDEESVSRLLPKGQMNLNSPLVGIVLSGINLAADGAITLERTVGADGQQALRVRCRRGLIQPDDVPIAPPRCVCDWDADLALRSTSKPIVIMLHGYKGVAASWSDFREHLIAHGYGTATIAYDFDLPIAQSAKEVSIAAQRELTTVIGTRYRIVLVGHSMGGLVAREWTENLDLPGSLIVGLITLGSPHGGSSWASMPGVSELFDRQGFSGNRLSELLLNKPSSKGLSDLEPGSSFLRQLAARPLRGDVAYTTVVGNRSPLDEADVAVLRGTLRTFDRQGSLLRLIRPRIQPLLGSFDELSNGKGDGAVACKNATIAGCRDVVTLPLTHLEMVRRSIQMPVNEPHPVWEVVEQRLAAITAR